MTQVHRPRPLLIATGIASAMLSFAAPAIAEERPAVGVERVKGGVVAAAISGQGIVVARHFPGGRVVVERRVRGHAPLVLARATLDLGTDVRVAASGAAVAVSFGSESSSDAEPSWVLVGPPTGPLREVARCAAGPVLPAVAAAGPRAAWAVGGCLVGFTTPPNDAPLQVEPAAVAIGDVNATSAPRRVGVAAGTVPVALALGGSRGLVATTRLNREFAYNTETRRLDGDALGEIVSRTPRELVLAVGVESAGRGVLLRPGFSQDDLDSEEAKARCPRVLRLPTAGVTRLLSLGSPPCIGADAYSGPVSLSRGRVVALTDNEPSREPIARIVSTRADGKGRPRLLARGTSRTPDGVTAANGTVVWWQPTCRGLDTEIVTIRDAPRRDPRVIRPCPTRR